MKLKRLVLLISHSTCHILMKTQKWNPLILMEITPKADSEYVSASIMLLCGIQMVWCAVKAHKCNQDDIHIWHWSDNLILNTHLYDFRFLDSEVALITSNAIVQVLYEENNVDWNEYLHLQKKQLPSLDEHKAIHNCREYWYLTTLGWFIRCQWKDGYTSW